MKLYMKIIKKIAISVIFIIMLAGENADISHATEKKDNVAKQVNETLVWSDEFEDEEFDLSIWSPTSNVIVEDGCAVLSIKYNNEKDEWTQAWLSTEGLFGFKYGRLEARIKMTTYPGEYGAFWTMGFNKQSADAESDVDGCRWSKCGEIDIMEQYDCDGKTSNPGAALHWCDSGNNRNAAMGLGKLMQTDTTKWHTYAVEWDEKSLVLIYDDTIIGNVEYNELDYYNGINPFHMSQYILLTLVQENKEIADKSLEPKMWVDWVRIYASEEVAGLKETQIKLKETGSGKSIKNGKMSVGSMAYMDVEFRPESVVKQSYKIISSNENVISVNGGVLTAVAPGKAIVVAVSPTGKQSAMMIQVYYDDEKNKLSDTDLENTDELLLNADSWYWGENYKELNLAGQMIHTDLIKAQPDSTYTIKTVNTVYNTKLQIIEYRKDGSYIQWADYKDEILKTSKDTAYIRINMIITKSGITMSYGDYLEALKYNILAVDKG